MRHRLYGLIVALLLVPSLSYGWTVYNGATDIKTVGGKSIIGSGNLSMADIMGASPHNLNLVTDNYAGRALQLRPDSMTATANLVTWSDISGNARDFTQGTAGNQPDVVETVLNGLPVVRFDGTDDFVGRDAIDLGNNWSFFAVFKTGTDVISKALFGEQYTGGANHVLYGLAADGSGNLTAKLFNNAAWVGASDTTPLAVSTVYMASAVRISASTLTLWKYGVQVGQATGANTTFVAGNQLYIGQSHIAAERWNGDIAEIIMLPTALSTTERQKIEGYLAHKYAIQANLDASHPYKTTAPQIEGLPEYADNAAAIAGGLTNGACYRTSTGVLMVRY